MSYLLPHCRSGWALDQAILAEEARRPRVTDGDRGRRPHARPPADAPVSGPGGRGALRPRLRGDVHADGRGTAARWTENATHVMSDARTLLLRRRSPPSPSPSRTSPSSTSSTSPRRAPEPRGLDGPLTLPAPQCALCFVRCFPGARLQRHVRAVRPVQRDVFLPQQAHHGGPGHGQQQQGAKRERSGADAKREGGVCSA